jgi:phosphatidylserine decarboxylase
MMSDSTPATPGLYDRFTTTLLRILPQHLLSALMYKIARSEVKWLKNTIIRYVVKKFNVDMTLAENEDALSYPSFNAFFTRELKTSVRPVAEEGVISPVDGKVSQCGRIAGDRLIQAKGHDFTLFALLAGNGSNASLFENGDFATIYLSPRDYHRIHMPFAGTLREMVFVPGDLFSVSEATTQLVPGLFARNERVICYFDTARGPMAVVLVGAIFVGSMQTVWHGEVRSAGDEPTSWTYSGKQSPHFEKGEEIARFNMGSTVILLHPQHATDFHANLCGHGVVVGEKIAD